MHRLLLHRRELQAREIRDAYRTYGCDMRALYKVLVEDDGKMIMGRLRERIEECSLQKIHEILRSGDEVSGHTSASIVMTMCQNQPQREQPEYIRSDGVTHIISGGAVWDALFAAHTVSLRDELAKWIGILQTMPQAAPMAGRLWEVFSHGQIYKGGLYTLVEMTAKISTKRDHLSSSPDKIQSIEIEPMNPQPVRIGDHCDLTPEAGVYYIPWARNNETFDSFFLSERKLISIQITLSTSHSFKAGGLAVLMKLLPTDYKLYHVFVVPTSCVEDFKCTVPVKLQERVQLFVLEMKQDYCEYCPPSEEI